MVCQLGRGSLAVNSTGNPSILEVLRVYYFVGSSLGILQTQNELHVVPLWGRAAPQRANFPNIFRLLFLLTVCSVNVVLEFRA